MEENIDLEDDKYTKYEHIAPFALSLLVLESNDVCDPPRSNFCPSP
jgi:hypothetical protein